MKKIILDRFAAFLLGSKIWGQVQAIVHELEDPRLTGENKRLLALDQLQLMGVELAKFLLNLAIELAVAKLRIG